AEAEGAEESGDHRSGQLDAAATPRTLARVGGPTRVKVADVPMPEMEVAEMQMAQVQSSAADERQDQKDQGKTADGQERAGNRTRPRGASRAGSGGQQVNRATAQGRPVGQTRRSPDRPNDETAITDRVDRR